MLHLLPLPVVEVARLVGPPSRWGRW
jgi:hypothetical protein